MKKNKNLLSQIFAEYKQIQWPTKSDVFQVTIIVMLITLFVSIMVFLFDFSFVSIMNQFQNLVRALIK